jgi:hypothetical protein
MNQYRYILEPYKGPATRYRCPSCNQARQFARYIDAETGEPVADVVGLCNRSNRCGYHYQPKQYFADNPSTNTLQAKPFKKPIYRAESPAPVDYLPADLVQQSCRHYESNHLHMAFTKWVGRDAANAVFERYRVGSSKHWPGATAFWQLDGAGRVRQCKIILYNPETGKRIKEGGDKVYFGGKAILKNYTANLVQCFFGEHLLKLYPQLPVAIVESEKTAMYCSLFYPNLVWIATGGKQGCRWTEKQVCKVLEGRTIVLFPDLQAATLWKQKAIEIATKVKCRIHVSEDLEAIASDEEKEAGLDLMDYLLAQGIIIPASQPPPKELAKANGVGGSYIEMKREFLDAKKEDFSQVYTNTLPKWQTNREPWPLDDLEKQLALLSISDGPLQLDCCSTIIDTGTFIESHLTTLKANSGNRYFQPYYSRLQNLINQYSFKKTI